MTRPQPPGLEGNLKELLSGGDDNWRSCPPLRPYTNAFVWIPQAGKILLGYKKRGFGLGMYNGFGGKVEPGETPLEAAKRELQEEAGIVADLEPCGTLLFVNGGQDFAHHIHIFRANEYDGVPTESDEMRPEWFSLPTEFCDHGHSGPTLPSIPFESMWEDDRFWMPLLLSKQYFIGRADFGTILGDASDENKFVMERWWFGAKTD